MPQQMRRQPLRHGTHGGGGTHVRNAAGMVCEPRHRKPPMAADIDALEGRQIHRHIERQSVIARTAADPESDAGQLGAAHIDPRRLSRTLRGHTQLGHIGDDGILERHDQLAHTQGMPPQIDEWIHHQLSRTVIGHLTAAVDLNHRNIARRQQMLAAGIQSQREHRRMFDEPDFVGSRTVSVVRKLLHRPPGRLVRHLAEMPDHGSVAHESRRIRDEAGVGAELSRPALLRASACSAR